MRLFVAVFPSPAAQRLAAEVTEALRHPNDGVAWVKPDNLHYTMRFIGEVGEDGARRVAAAAHAAVAGHVAFEAALGAPGAFPNPRRARVLWLGMAAGAAPLIALAQSLERALDAKGFEPEGRPFAAHLTLGRVREPREDWTARLAGAPQLAGAAARFHVDRLCVVESRLSPKGSIYSVRDAAPLEG